MDTKKDLSKDNALEKIANHMEGENTGIPIYRPILGK